MWPNINFTGIFFTAALISAGVGLVSFIMLSKKSTSKKAERSLKIWVGIFYFFVYLTGLTTPSKDSFWLWAIFGAMPFVILLLAIIFGEILKRNEKLRFFIQSILNRKNQ
jgi:hypothetical protein